MALSSQRQPGYSRRARYSLFAAYVAAVACAVLGLLLLVVSVIDPTGFGAVRGVATDATAPVSAGGRGIVRWVGSAADEIGAYFWAGSKNKALSAEVAASRPKLIEAEALARDNLRLKRMLKLIEKHPDVVATARVVSSSASSTRRYAILTAGRSEGLRSGQPVRSSEGLIGRIVETGILTSRVMMIVDPASVVPVRRLTDGMPAIATGRGDGGVDIRPLSAGRNPFALKDIFVTSGVGGIYEPGIPVAMAVRVDTEGAIGRPFADPDRLDFALIQTIFVAPDVAPPAPGPAPDPADAQ